MQVVRQRVVCGVDLRMGDQRVIVAGNCVTPDGINPGTRITPADMRHLMTGGTNGGEQLFTCDFRITKNAETHVVNPFRGRPAARSCAAALVITRSSSATMAAPTRPLFAFHGDAACAIIATKKTA